jgi:WD40 repeat protein
MLPRHARALGLACLLVAPLAAQGLTAVDRYGDPLPAGAVARLGTTRLGHHESIGAIAFSPDGCLLASGSHDGMVRFWDRSTGASAQANLSVEGMVRLLAFSPNGAILASWAGGESIDQLYPIRLWDVSSGEELLRLDGHKSRCRGLAFSPDGRTLASTGSDNVVRLWDIATGVERRNLSGSASYTQAVAFSPDGKSLAFAGDNGVFVCQAAGDQVQRGPRSTGAAAADLAFSPDGKLLAVGFATEIILWDLAVGKVARELPQGCNTSGTLVFSADGRRLTAADGQSVRVWEAASGRELKQIGGYDARGRVMTLSPDGRTLATSDADSVHLWDLSTGKELFPRDTHEAAVPFLEFTPDGRTLIAGSGRTIYFWDSRSGKLRHWVREEDPVRALRLSPDGSELATWHGRQRLYFWDPVRGKPLRSLDVPADPQRGEILRGGCGAFSPDLKVMAAWSSPTVMRGALRLSFGIDLCDASTGRVIALLKDLDAGFTSSVVFSPDGLLLASVEDGFGGVSIVRLWQATTEEQIGQIDVHEGVLTRGSLPVLAFSGDSRLLAIGTMEGSVILWDTRSGGRIRTLSKYEEFVRVVTFSPDGRMLASADNEGTIRVWETATGTERRRFRGHEKDLLTLAFSRDGRFLASGSSDTTVLVWDIFGRTAEDAGKGVATLAEPERLWSDLIDRDGARAFQAVRLLIASGKQGVEVLRAKARPAMSAEPAVLKRLIAELDDDDFDTRERATAELERLRELADPALLAALKRHPSAEVRRRAGLVLEGRIAREWDLDGERLRLRRTLEVLEQIGTPEAVAVVKTLACGAEEAFVTREARASLKRMTRSEAVKR